MTDLPAGPVSILDLPIPQDAVWPESLGPPNTASYSYTVAPPVVRTGFDSGHSRQRYRRAARPRMTMTLGWTLDTAHMALFAECADAFAYAWFEMKLPTPATPGGTLLETPLMLRFTSGYTVSPAGFDRYTVGIEAEARDWRLAREAVSAAYWTNDGAVYYWPSDTQPLTGRF